MIGIQDEIHKLCFPDMKHRQNISTGEGYMPGLAIDCVIFGYHGNQLKILLLEYKETGVFALPGGFIGVDEDMNSAARRILADRTTLKNIYLEQFHTFGDISRHDPAPLRAIIKAKQMSVTKDHWLLARFVTTGYYALVDFEETVPVPDPLSDNCSWYDLKKLPRLMLDHNAIVKKALQTLRSNIDRKTWTEPLLPKAFTMNDLQRLYETVLGERINRTAFHRKMLNLGVLERIEKKYTGLAHKSPYLYRFAK